MRKNGKDEEWMKHIEIVRSANNSTGIGSLEDTLHFGPLDECLRYFGALLVHLETRAIEK